MALQFVVRASEAIYFETLLQFFQQKISFQTILALLFNLSKNHINTTRVFRTLSNFQEGAFFENNVKSSVLRWLYEFMLQIRFWLTRRSTMTIIFQIILSSVLLGIGVLANSYLSKSSSSYDKFLYQPSIYLQQGTDPNSTLYPVLYKVANTTGRYFIVKVYFKGQDC